MQSPAGNASRGLPGGPPSTVASGAGRCESGALMHSFGIFLQGLLGVVAFSTLMLKRFREPKHERRPWRIWFLDTSKQAIGMLFIHFANVYLADLTEEDPCSLYLINFLLDATVGMLLIYVGVRAVSVLVEWQQWESLRFGEYAGPGCLQAEAPLPRWSSINGTFALREPQRTRGRESGWNSGSALSCPKELMAVGSRATHS
ncbi:store-operated calcium entry regulator STIMATE isoform X3 [Macaca fascicularis]|uniref:store-operated calcium entry regulator STIMATE isoform X3 n=1 Tax=Macaca fascicularis TaxID=9541 RepID=UPI003D159BA6